MSPPPLFGILQLDKGEPYGYAQLPGLLQSWVQDAGGFATVGLIVYILYALSTPTHKSESERMRVPLPTFLLLMTALSLVCYAVVLALLILGKGSAPTPPLPPPGMPIPVEAPAVQTQLRPLFMTAGGLFALLGFLQPFVRDLRKQRLRRVRALAWLSFKDASQSKSLWVVIVAAGSLLFAFPANWFYTFRPEDELRSVIDNVDYFAIMMLFLAAALTAFNLPTDIKRQTVHTVVTKPVERFEIVIGLFIGYVTLMTIVLAGFTAFSLVLIQVNKVDESAVEQTMKARVPVRGKLEFKSRKDDFGGTNVGKEFDYRKYIAGHPQSSHRAVWSFDAVPRGLVRPADDRVPVEFTFDIFRLTKGKEDKGGSGVEVQIRFATHNCPQRRPDPAREGETGDWPWVNDDLREKYQRDADALRKRGINPVLARPGRPGWDEVNALAEKYGFYEIPTKEVFNNRVMTVEVPAGLFRNALQNPPADPAAPLFQVYVKCVSPGQMLGVAGPDLYLLEGNQSFSQNYVKGIVGLWFRVCLVIGLAVACSTYLNGVISLLATAFLFMCGYITEHIRELASNHSFGGGPFESLSRLVKAEGPTAQLGDTAGARAIQFFDRISAWVFRRFENLVPDVNAFEWSEFVKEGFNVSNEYLLLNLLLLVGYLLPWAVLAYYLMKSREIASS